MRNAEHKMCKKKEINISVSVIKGYQEDGVMHSYKESILKDMCSGMEYAC
jgi:hypothetical protein